MGIALKLYETSQKFCSSWPARETSTDPVGKMRLFGGFKHVTFGWNQNLMINFESNSIMFESNFNHVWWYSMMIQIDSHCNFWNGNGSRNQQPEDVPVSFKQCSHDAWGDSKALRSWDRVFSISGWTRTCSLRVLKFPGWPKHCWNPRVAWNHVEPTWTHPQ